MSTAYKKYKQYPGPSKWFSLEFMVYYVIQLMLWPILYYQSYALSQPTNPLSPLLRPSLSISWWYQLNPWMDNSDRQYAGFRNQLPILLLASCIYVLVSWFVRYINRINWMTYSLVFSFGFLTVAHGFHLLKIVLLILVNYTIAKLLNKSIWNPILTWGFNIGVLFLIEYTDGLAFLNINAYSGLMRWNITFNFCILRFISFNMDYYWAHHPSDTLQKHLHLTHKPISTQNEYPKVHGQVYNDKLNTKTAHPLSTYTFYTCTVYVLYVPLYFAGPIMTFNAWMWQVQAPTVPKSKVLVYLVRWTGAVLLMELMMHLFHVVALAHTPDWFVNLTPSEIVSVGFINLKFIWLKLLIIWRFFRLWAMSDGLDPPENMVRCMTNNYSTLEFWRDWHASFNLWNVRYLYLPMGGARYRFVSIWVIFTFVAIWHDIKLQLLSWGWLICLFILPEVVAKYAFRNHTRKFWYRSIAALGGVFNICLMMTANLVGFVLGPTGMLQVWRSQWTSSSIGFLACTLMLGYALVQVQFEVRDSEVRRGYKLYTEPELVDSLQDHVSSDSEVVRRQENGSEYELVQR